MKSVPDSPLDPITEQQTKLDRAHWLVQKLQVMAMRPDQPHDQAVLLRELERSVRAEVKLRQKALGFLKRQGENPNPPDAANPANPEIAPEPNATPTLPSQPPQAS